ncbi:MAG: WD40/YVTN/BNR-like repeat-containing protein [Telluria sp.]
MKESMRTNFRLLIGTTICAMNIATSANTPPMPSGPEIVDIQAGASDEIYAFVSRSGVFRRAGEQAWTKVVNDPDAAWGQIFRRPDGMLMLSNFAGGAVYLSSDRGAHWQKMGVSQRLPESNQIDEDSRVRHTAFSGDGAAYVLSRSALLFSDDGGITWQRRALPPAVPGNPSESQAIVARDQVVFLLSGGTLYKSVAQGAGWDVVEQTLGAASPIVKGLDGKAPLLGFGPEGRLLALGPSATSQHVAVSTDQGKSWHEERFGFGGNAAFTMRLFEPKPDAAYFFLRSEPPATQPFKAVYRWPAAGAAAEIAFDANRVRKIMQGPDGKLYMTLLDHSDALESVDGGKTWKGIPHAGMTW